jgi:hypothetical protein
VGTAITGIASNITVNAISAINNVFLFIFSHLLLSCFFLFLGNKIKYLTGCSLLLVSLKKLATAFAEL